MSWWSSVISCDRFQLRPEKATVCPIIFLTFFSFRETEVFVGGGVPAGASSICLTSEHPTNNPDCVLNNSCRLSDGYLIATFSPSLTSSLRVCVFFSLSHFRSIGSASLLIWFVSSSHSVNPSIDLVIQRTFRRYLLGDRTYRSPYLSRLSRWRWCARETRNVYIRTH